MAQPMYVEQPIPTVESPPPTASFMSCVTISCFLKVVAVAITGVAIIVLLSTMSTDNNQSPSPPLPTPFTLKFILNDFQVLDLNPNVSDHTINCSLIIHISVIKTDMTSWYSLPNPFAEVAIGDVTTITTPFPPLTVDTPDRAEWTLAVNEAITSVDQEKLAHLKESVDGVNPILFTVVIVGRDLHYHPFNATCSANIYVFDSKPPPAISTCMITR